MTGTDPVSEMSWSLHVNGERVASGASSPGAENELGAGRLVAGGYVRARADLESIRSSVLAGGCTRIDASVRTDVFEAARFEHAHCEEHGCGLLHFAVCAGASTPVFPQIEPPDGAAIADALRGLLDACGRERPGGGVHAARLWTDDGPAPAIIDVARHAAVDRAVGGAFLDKGLPLSGGLLLSARVSGAIAHAAMRSGIGWIASRSIPTTLALRIADAAGITIIARGASHGAHTFVPSPAGTR